MGISHYGVVGSFFALFDEAIICDDGVADLHWRAVQVSARYKNASQ